VDFKNILILIIMKKNLVVILIFWSLVYACKTESKKISPEQCKSEILQAEKNFARMAKEEGLAKAFCTFAAEDAVIHRDSLYKGKDAIKAFYERQTNKDVKLEWTAKFVDVSASGDLGYTFGTFSYAAVDGSGLPVSVKGIFHTVWKRQADGNWRFVWD
jgi:ketosteroid isomerase-like protein